jgi:hypothetical protein
MLIGSENDPPMYSGTPAGTKPYLFLLAILHFAVVQWRIVRSCVQIAWA